MNRREKALLRFMYECAVDWKGNQYPEEWEGYNKLMEECRQILKKVHVRVKRPETL